MGAFLTDKQFFIPFTLFYLLEVGILDVVILWSTLLLSLLLTSERILLLRTCLSTLCTLIHLL